MTRAKPLMILTSQPRGLRQAVGKFKIVSGTPNSELKLFWLFLVSKLLATTEYTICFVDVLPTEPVIAITWGRYLVSTKRASHSSTFTTIFLNRAFIFI